MKLARRALAPLALAAVLSTTVLSTSGCATVIAATLASLCGNSECASSAMRAGIETDLAIAEGAARASTARAREAVQVRYFGCDGLLYAAPSRIEARTLCVEEIEAAGMTAKPGDCRCAEAAAPVR